MKGKEKRINLNHHISSDFLCSPISQSRKPKWHPYIEQKRSYDNLPAITNAFNNLYWIPAFPLFSNDLIFTFTQALRSTLGGTLTARVLYCEGHNKLCRFHLSSQHSFNFVLSHCVFKCIIFLNLRQVLEHQNLTFLMHTHVIVNTR